MPIEVSFSTDEKHTITTGSHVFLMICWIPLRKSIFAVESTMSMKMALETRERGQTDMQGGAR